MAEKENKMGILRKAKEAVEMKKGGSKKDACYHKVKARYTRNGGTWPSAYGSGALVKCRKVGAANWGNSKKKKKKRKKRR